MMATVKEIQVNGGRLVYNLADACIEYLAQLETTDRIKMNFSILLASGEVKSITIRQEENEIVAYGDFEGLPSFLEWSQGKE